MQKLTKISAEDMSFMEQKSLQVLKKNICTFIHGYKELDVSNNMCALICISFRPSKNINFICIC